VPGFIGEGPVMGKRPTRLPIQARGAPRRCRISVLASLVISRAVAPREEEAMLRERFEDIAQREPHMMRRSPAARCADLLIARYRHPPVGINRFLVPPLDLPLDFGAEADPDRRRDASALR
jgi:hypothetical protein